MPVNSLRVGTNWIGIEVVSEPTVLLTFRGYAPVLLVKVLQSGLEKQLYIGAKSIAEPLEEIRNRHGGNFTGLRLRIRKESDEQMSKYVVENM